jgi:hypothetical protein
MVCQFQNGMVSPPATSEVGVHAAGDTKSEHFEPAGVRNINEKQFSFVIKIACSLALIMWTLLPQ